LRDDVRKYFLYMFDQEPSHRWLTYLRRPLDERNWEFFLDQHRNMWSTASLLHAAGQTVSTSGAIQPAASCPNPVFRFIPITVSCADDGESTWAPVAGGSTNRYLFEITDEQAYAAAMPAALHSLLRTL
jgi:hypothetical protein